MSHRKLGPPKAGVLRPLTYREKMALKVRKAKVYIEALKDGVYAFSEEKGKPLMISEDQFKGLKAFWEFKDPAVWTNTNFLRY